jgi:hypothetical protein
VLLRVAAFLGWMHLTNLIGAIFALVFSLLGAAASAEVLPKMRWDGHASAKVWTVSALEAVAAQDSKLASKVPADIEAWCPGYDSASTDERRAFWVAVLSGVAKYESGYNAKAAGGGRYYGLMQISPKTAAAYRCEARSAAALKDGSANLDCAIKIIARQVGRDGMVTGNGNRGVDRDWGPMSKASVRRAISGWTSQQAYCKA